VRAVSDTKVLRLDEDALEILLQEYPLQRELIRKGIIERFDHPGKDHLLLCMEILSQLIICFPLGCKRISTHNPWLSFVNLSRYT
jgi:hypothetical protein